MPKVRTLIIGTSRSGTTTLNKALSKIFNTSSLAEPWNTALHPREKHKYPECILKYNCVKTLIDQLPPNYNEPLEFFTYLVEYFDHVILLGRKNRVELAESYEAALSKGSDPRFWNEVYYLDDSKDLKLNMKLHNFLCDSLEKVSKHLNIPITWYEDLYSGNLKSIQKCIDSWGIDLDSKQLFKYVDPKYKYRLKKPKPVI